eukprot:14678599-Alexandrium_andersonii.AAC.1
MVSEVTRCMTASSAHLPPCESALRLRLPACEHANSPTNPRGEGPHELRGVPVPRIARPCAADHSFCHPPHHGPEVGP